MNYVNKEDIPKYPLIKFKGKIHLVDKKQNIEKFCKIISKQEIIGFDTETKPSFKRGVSYNVSLLQFSFSNQAFIFRLNKIGLDDKLIHILCNPSIAKVGIDIKNDISGLKKIKFFNESNIIDLNLLAVEKGFKSIGAVKLSIMLLGYRISKKQRLSDWGSNRLTMSQLIYAATDAWICVKIFQSFKDKSLYP